MIHACVSAGSAGGGVLIVPFGHNNIPRTEYGGRALFTRWSPSGRTRYHSAMKSTDFELTIERDRKGYYVATVPSLRGCHTQAKSLDELMDRVREAIELCLEVEGDEALEDVALAQAMEEAEGSPLTNRDEVFKILDEPL
jgi:predicted RNase H-like HicB family nuclease